MTSNDVSTARLAARYGAPAPWRRRSVGVVIGVIVLAFAVWLVWTIRGQSDPAVSSQMVGYDVVDAQTATAQVQVQIARPTTATCKVQAFAADHSLVGEYDFTPVDTVGTSTYNETIHTERLATAVQLVGCTAPGQPRPR